MNDGTFWAVFRDQNTLLAHRRHPSRESAINEAKRLAEEARGVKFYVAAFTGYAEYPRQEAFWNELERTR